MNGDLRTLGGVGTMDKASPEIADYGFREWVTVHGNENERALHPNGRCHAVGKGTLSMVTTGKNCERLRCT